MKFITTTNARKNIKKIIDLVKFSGEVIGIGRRDSIDALLIQFPNQYNSDLSDVTNINANSKSFDFLLKEKDIYSLSDLKKRNA